MLSLSASLKHRVVGIYTGGWLESFSYREPSLRMTFNFKGMCSEKQGWNHDQNAYAIVYFQG